MPTLNFQLKSSFTNTLAVQVTQKVDTYWFMYYFIRWHSIRPRSQRKNPKHSAILHGEMSALENAGRLPGKTYKDCTIYTTLSPCSMCTGAILLYGFKRVVMGENVNFLGNEKLLIENGVEVVNLNDQECIDLMAKFIKEKPQDWNEDIGE